MKPYYVLVSEVMLQQTQVATVEPYFLRFTNRLPTLESLAAADERLVLRLWQGLGYYRRARNLLMAAHRIVAEHNGQIPRDVVSLLKLPGIGQYTAGAIASIAYDIPAPILDGNVARVLCRLDGIGTDPREPATRRRLWQRAAQILPQRRCGDFNSALMDLGATICTPRSPKCSACPVRRYCTAVAMGMQEQIPPVGKTKPVPLVRRRTFCLRKQDGNGQDRWLIEQRPATGRWPGMWQFITIAPNGRLSRVAIGVKLRSAAACKIGAFEHALSHRRYRFDVYLGEVDARDGRLLPDNRRWVRLCDLRHYPLPRPHLRIAQMLRQLN